MFEREIVLIGEENFKKIKSSHVAVFGIGGVGSYVVEALARAGVGKITIVDFDVIELSNLNRQVHTHINNIEKLKVDEMEKRVKLINPDIEVVSINKMYDKDSHDEIFNEEWDYIVDAIDLIISKILLIKKANEFGIKIIASMGTANKIDPSKFRIDDINNSNTCPLARVIRRRVKKLGIKSLKVLFSTEYPSNYVHDNDVKGTISFIPSIAGLLIAAEVIKDIINLDYLDEK
jgi:tRNA A37 threonylcarbamoyladenosine dehydratase